MPSAMAHFSTESAQNSGRAMNQMPRLSAEEADSGEQLTALCAQNSLGLADISQQRAMDDRQNADPAVRAVSEKLGSDRILSWAIYPFPHARWAQSATASRANPMELQGSASFGASGGV